MITNNSFNASFPSHLSSTVKPTGKGSVGSSIYWWVPEIKVLLGFVGEAAGMQPTQVESCVVPMNSLLMIDQWTGVSPSSSPRACNTVSTAWVSFHMKNDRIIVERLSHNCELWDIPPSEGHRFNGLNNGDFTECRVLRMSRDVLFSNNRFYPFLLASTTIYTQTRLLNECFPRWLRHTSWHPMLRKNFDFPNLGDTDLLV